VDADIHVTEAMRHDGFGKLILHEATVLSDKRKLLKALAR